MKNKKTTDAITILYNRYYKDNPEALKLLEQERTNARIARELYDLRAKSGLTQRQLAKLVGTTPSVISRLENADYSGHSLSMLQRIAAVLNRRVEVKFVAISKRAHALAGSR
jgi:DNA-binding XRE family transcriptional regulator